MRNGLPLHAGMSVGQKQRRRKNKKTYCHVVQPKLQSQKNDSRIQETTVTRLTQKRLSTTIVQHLALNLSPGPTKNHREYANLILPCGINPFETYATVKLDHETRRIRDEHKKNNSWVATTQDTARSFSIKNFPTGPKARGVNMNIEVSRLASIDLGALEKGRARCPMWSNHRTSEDDWGSATTSETKGI